MPIGSDQIPDNGPPAVQRGVRWARFAPVGYKRLEATNAEGALVMQIDYHETVLDGGEVDRGWAWLDRHCPALGAPRQASHEYPRPRLMA